MDVKTIAWVFKEASFSASHAAQASVRRTIMHAQLEALNAEETEEADFWKRVLEHFDKDI